MPKFKKKPVEIEAWHFSGDMKSAETIVQNDASMHILSNEDGAVFIIVDTLEGRMTANAGDWVIKGVKGEFYPCKPDIFSSTYEPV